jgi:hypothetical protein
VTTFLDLASLEPDELAEMRRAGDVVLECMQALEDGELTLVGEIKRGHGEQEELEHYPPDDVQQEQSQYFFHWHEDRGDVEIGHFHTFLRMHDDEATHLVAISMADEATPVALFCTNQWVTDEHMVNAPKLAEKLPLFKIDHANPSWPVNRWITAMLVLFRPQVSFLLHHRDERLGEAATESGRNLDLVRRDHDIEVTGLLAIDIPEQIRAIEAAMAKQQSSDAQDAT